VSLVSTISGLSVTDVVVTSYRCRERDQSAQKLYARLPSHYVDYRWLRIESLLLLRSNKLQERLELPKERLLTSLALVRAGIEFGSISWSLDSLRDTESPTSSPEEKKKLATQLMADVRRLASLLTKGAFILESASRVAEAESLRNPQILLLLRSQHSQYGWRAIGVLLKLFKMVSPFPSLSKVYSLA
jgi:hypothetical protein